MKRIDSVNIICVGKWNKKIFTPGWVSTNLFELEENTNFQGMVDPEEMEFGYSNKGVLLLPKDNLLEIKLDKINEESILFGGTLLKKILTILPHTPIKAIGINIRFKFSKNEKNSIVTALNKVYCPLKGFTMSQVKLSKQIKDCQLNIITDIISDKLLVNFNYHYNAGYDKLSENILKEKVSYTLNVIKDE